LRTESEVGVVVGGRTDMPLGTARINRSAFAQEVVA
jgi:hypothetical protein